MTADSEDSSNPKEKAVLAARLGLEAQQRKNAQLALELDAAKVRIAKALKERNQ